MGSPFLTFPYRNSRPPAVLSLPSEQYLWSSAAGFFPLLSTLLDGHATATVVGRFETYGRYQHAVSQGINYRFVDENQNSHVGSGLSLATFTNLCERMLKSIKLLASFPDYQSAGRDCGPFGLDHRLGHFDSCLGR